MSIRQIRKPNDDIRSQFLYHIQPFLVLQNPGSRRGYNRDGVRRIRLRGDDGLCSPSTEYEDIVVLCDDEFAESRFLGVGLRYIQDRD